MKKTVSQELPSEQSTSKGSKEKIKAAYVQLAMKIYDLVDIHSTYAGDSTKSPLNHHLETQTHDVYTNSLIEIMDALKPLGDLLNLKQAGGPRPKSDYSVSHRLLKTHYIETEKILTAPALIKRYNLEVYGERFPVDKNGNEPLSEKVAREHISYFKRRLPQQDFSRN